MQLSSLFYSTTLSKEKVAMAAPEDNENCHHVKNDPQRCKVENFILISGGVTELLKEVSPGAAEIPALSPGEVGLTTELASNELKYQLSTW